MTTGASIALDLVTKAQRQPGVFDSRSFEFDLTTPAARGRVVIEILPALRGSHDAPHAYPDLISRLIGSDPTRDCEVVSWATSLTKQSHEPIAVDLLTLAIERFSSRPKLKCKLLQICLANGETAVAGDWADRWASCPEMDERLACFILLALARSGRKAGIRRFHERWSSALNLDARSNGIIMTALDELGCAVEAIRVGEACLERAGTGTPQIHGLLAGLYDRAGRADEAIEHYGLALEDDPDGVAWNTALGGLLLNAGRADLACEHLSRVSRAAPNLVRAKMLLARAMRSNGEFDAAADLMTDLDDTTIADNYVARRQVISALSLAGRKSEASERYDALLLEREEALPTDFAEGLAALDSKIDDVRIPDSRLDWAWSLRDSSRHPDRAIWERRAKWGYLADRFVLDWLECRPEQAEQAMRLLTDLGEFERMLDEARAEGASVIIASAHLGALYAGPLILELLGVRSRWMASTPSLENAPFRSSLISTSDQTEAQVVRSVIRAMDEGSAIVLAVDGAMSPSAPHVPFEGREVTYSAFAARLAYKRNATSFFCVPCWSSDERIELYVRPMPRAARGESESEFSRRWRTDYFEHVRTILSGRPENLKLSGGIWRAR